MLYVRQTPCHSVASHLVSAVSTRRRECRYDRGGMHDDLPASFVRYAADILGETNSGLSGGNIISATNAYAVEFGVRVPHAAMTVNIGNKRTALFENLLAFSPAQRFRIIRELCDHRSFALRQPDELKQLKVKLVTQYGHLDPQPLTAQINQPLVEETKHWLTGYPTAASLYAEALQKYRHGAFQRNLLDDLRLALESLLRELFGNQKSLENQLPAVGAYIKAAGGSPQLANMFHRLLDYYSKYQNDHVKHNDAVIETEIEFVLEVTSSFMKHLVRIKKPGP